MDLEALREAGGAIAGVAVGIVKANDDPAGLGRVKLNLPWRRSDFLTDWVRIVAPMGGGDRGACFIPEVGDEVLVAFDRDDIRYPYVLGALWSEADKPPEGNAGGRNDIRIIKSRRGHMIRFDDGVAKGVITIRLDDGKKVEIDDDGICMTDGSSRVEIASRGGAITIEAASSLTLKAPQIRIEATGRLALDGGAELGAKAGMVRIN